MKEFKNLLLIFLFFVSVTLFPASAGHCAENMPVPESDSSRGVRIAEYLNSSTARLLLMKLDAHLTDLYGSKSEWQTMEVQNDGGNSEILNAGIVGRNNIIFTDDEEYIKGIESMGLIKRSIILFTEEIILAGPDYPKFNEGSSALDMLSVIFKENRLFLTLMNNKFIEGEELKLWKEAGVTSPNENKNYVESGKDEISALMQTGDEGAYILVGEGAFAEYQDVQRIETPLVCLSRTKVFRKHYALLVAYESSRNERAKRAEKYMDWLSGGEGRAFINGFELGGRAPFRFFED